MHVRDVKTVARGKIGKINEIQVPKKIFNKLLEHEDRNRKDDSNDNIIMIRLLIVIIILTATMSFLCPY